MTQLPSQPMPYQNPHPEEQHFSTLDTLAIFYFIIAGLEALVACIFLIYIAIGVVIALIGVTSTQKGDAAAGIGFGGAFACFGLCLMAFLGTFAYLNFLAGKSLRQHKRLTLCYIMAGIACLNFPLGTLLGVFTFVTLGKPGVKEAFH